MKKFYLFSLSIVTISFYGNLNNIKIKKEDISSKVKHLYLTTGQEQVIIDGSIGVIVMSNKYKYGDVIEIYDREGCLWDTVSIDHEYERLNIKCISIGNKYYKIYDNSLTGGQIITSIKFIRKNNENIVFKTWKQYILSEVFAINFNPTNNPLLTSLSRKNPHKIHYNKYETYHPVQIKGQWLQVKWGSENNWKYGWIKWKEEEKLLIELFFFA